VTRTNTSITSEGSNLGGCSSKHAEYEAQVSHDHHRRAENWTTAASSPHSPS
jgi:hypothetical protein